MKIAIVDDEKQWRDAALNEIRLHYQKNEILISAYTCGEELIQQNADYDIIFLDVEMKGLDGFETAKIYRQNHPDSIVMILTRHIELSRQGYLVNAFRYIDKMNMLSEISEALSAVDKLLSHNQKIEVSVVNLGTISLLLKDILFVETEKRNVRIHTKAQDYISRENISCMEARLEPYGFYRCHKSYIISLDAVKFFDRVNVHMVDGSCAMVSVRKYAELKRRYLERRLEYLNE